MKTAKTTTTFQTPHESKAKKAAKVKKGNTKTTKPTAGKDAFGGRIGSRMSKINLVVINAGAKGATVLQVAEQTGESAAIVSAQLGWAVNKLMVATRKEEKPADGRKSYFAKG
jgi:hypothetical protein